MMSEKAIKRIFRKIHFRKLDFISLAAVLICVLMGFLIVKATDTTQKTVESFADSEQYAPLIKIIKNYDLDDFKSITGASDLKEIVGAQDYEAVKNAVKANPALKKRAEEFVESNREN